MAYTKRHFIPLMLLLTIGVFGAAGAGAGVAGKWSGTIGVQDPGSGSEVSTPVQLELEVSSSGAITGKIGREGEAEPVAIQHGTLDGSSLSFDASSAETEGPMKFTLLLDGDRLEGQMKGAIESETIQGKVKLNRE